MTRVEFVDHKSACLTRLKTYTILCFMLSVPYILKNNELTGRDAERFDKVGLLAAYCSGFNR